MNNKQREKLVICCKKRKKVFKERNQPISNKVKKMILALEAWHHPEFDKSYRKIPDHQDDSAIQMYHGK